jgi:hypothetical protein
MKMLRAVKTAREENEKSDPVQTGNPEKGRLANSLLIIFWHIDLSNTYFMPDR